MISKYNQPNKLFVTYIYNVVFTIIIKGFGIGRNHHGSLDTHSLFTLKHYKVQKSITIM